MAEVDIVLAVLHSGSMSAAELAAVTGLRVDAVNRALGKLHARRVIRICEWRKLPESIRLVRVFEVGGRKSDVLKPRDYRSIKRAQSKKSNIARANFAAGREVKAAKQRQQKLDRVDAEARNRPFASLLAFGSSTSKE